eukprot:303597-Alexandrium_andersonii.AAC.1
MSASLVGSEMCIRDSTHTECSHRRGDKCCSHKRENARSNQARPETRGHRAEHSAGVVPEKAPIVLSSIFVSFESAAARRR